MNRSKLSTIVVVLLVLSQHAQGADVQLAKGPLTAAEKAKCQALRTEFNLGVQAYNAELEEIKKVEAEIPLLKAAIDKEQAAVDVRDNVAMQGLNARIDKNNELVARHEALSASIKAKGIESKQRAAQFSEACENRGLAMSPPLQATPSDAVCSSTTGAKGVARQIEATFDEKQGKV